MCYVKASSEVSVKCHGMYIHVCMYIYSALNGPQYTPLAPNPVDANALSIGGGGLSWRSSNARTHGTRYVFICETDAAVSMLKSLAGVHEGSGHGHGRHEV